MATPTSPDSTRLRHLLAQLPYNLVPHAIAAGVAPGRIYLNAPARPRSAIVWDGGGDVFLTGDPEAPGALSLARRLLADEILTRATAQHWPGFTVFPSSAWLGDPVARVLPDRQLVSARRLLFTKAVDRGVLPALAPGFSLAQVDGAFMQREDLRCAESLREWLQVCWASLEAFAMHGFGTCVLEGNTGVSWCMGEYVSGGRCGIGIETGEPYRRQGFAAAAAAAFLRAARERRLLPHWECWADNASSVATARKVGFTGCIEYDVYWVPLGTS